jgi:hypothetical protein
VAALAFKLHPGCPNAFCSQITICSVHRYTYIYIYIILLMSFSHQVPSGVCSRNLRVEPAPMAQSSDVFWARLYSLSDKEIHLIWDFVGEHFEKTTCWRIHIHGSRDAPRPRWLLLANLLLHGTRLPVRPRFGATIRGSYISYRENRLFGEANFENNMRRLRKRWEKPKVSM